jgi:uncharacterized protein DUF5996
MTLSTFADPSGRADRWPSLALEDWKDTYATLHMWTQIVGKIRLVQTPWVNHSWHVTYQVTSRGVSTLPIPYEGRTFQIDFDFNDHRLLIQTSDGAQRTMALRPRSVADFYEELLALLAGLGFAIEIHTTPNEIAEAIPFEKDTVHASYDAEYANRFWRVLLQADRIFRRFRARFIGKSSPVHFFWGGFDLAVTRFSGRPAPVHPGGVPNLPDWIAREAYSHEVSSCGFWPGGDPAPYPMFYSYAYPEPDGFSSSLVRPRSAAYHATLHEFVLPYDEVRQAQAPETVLLEFLQSTYDAAADTGAWDRAALERPAGDWQRAFRTAIGPGGATG